MNTIGDRISYKDHDDCTTIIVSTKIDKWKETMLFTWLLGWTICGVGMIYFLYAGGFSKDQKLVLLTMTVFWLFFEIRIGKTWLWRKFGIEFIRIDKDIMTIKKAIGKYGEAVPYQLGRIKELKAVDQNPKAFAKVMNDSFWVMGQGMISFMNDDKEVRFGMQLEKEEAEKLSKVMRKLITNYNKEGIKVFQDQSSN